MSSKRNPWAFKIDYVKEIFNDERHLDYLTNPVHDRLLADLDDQERAAVEQHPQDVLSILFWRTERIDARRQILGLSPEEVRAVAIYDDRATYVFPEGDDQMLRKGDYARYDAVVAVWGRFDLMPQARREKQLKTTKASLARHKRNQKKYA